MRGRLQLIAWTAAITLHGLIAHTTQACVAPASSSACACGAEASIQASQAGAAATANLQIVNFAFSPPNLTVPQGDTVRWTNLDSSAHTVSGEQNVFDSGLLGQGQVFSHTFNQPGVFNYICEIHPFMEGSVTVTPVPEPTTAGVALAASLMLTIRRGRRGPNGPPAPSRRPA